MMLYFIVPAFTIATFILTIWLLHNVFLKSGTGKRFMDKRVAVVTNILFTDLASMLNINNHLEQEIAQPQYFEKIKPFIETQVDDFMRVKLLKEMPVIGSLIGEQTILKLKAIFMEELKIIFPGAITQYASGLNQDFAGKILQLADVKPLQRSIALAVNKEIINILSRLYLPAIILGLLQGLIIDLLIRFFQ